MTAATGRPTHATVTEDVESHMAAVIGNARAFVRVADEFWPEFPDAIGEHLDHLGTSIDRLGKMLAGASPAEADVVMALTGGMPLEEWRRQFTEASLRNDIKALLSADPVARLERRVAVLREAAQALCDSAEEMAGCCDYHDMASRAYRAVAAANAALAETEEQK